MRPVPITAETDAAILRLIKAGVSVRETARRLDLSDKFVTKRRNALLGRVPRQWQALPRDAEPIAITGGPLCPQDDSRHVEACLAHGGFVRAEVINGRTVWVAP